MVKRGVVSFVILVSIVSILLLFVGALFLTNRAKQIDDLFVGVTFSLDSTAEARLLINRVKGYTNLLVVNSGPVSKNESSLNEICDYAVDSGLNILVYFGKLSEPWQLPWIGSASQKWGERFLGIYFFDEPAGSLLDTDDEYIASNTPGTYDEMADLFVNSWLTMPGLHTIKTTHPSIVSFTSDYALYWFDYLAGYDVLLAQFGWNHSRAQDIALVRGAARVQNKAWGAIITWTYTDPPYLETGDRLFDDMFLAYENGARYIVVFNYPKTGDYGILKDEHFDAIERFWESVRKDSNYTPVTAKTALVLPKNYGWGMRNPNDVIWGIWGPDEKSTQIWNITRTLLAQEFPNIDLMYDDDSFSFKDKYSKIYYWNSVLE